MMKFLASVYFALVLIFLSIVLVIAGTFEESIYKHPLFQLLLLGYFINILFSSFSRYPFKKKHIPFLITHLGLLMIITGVFIKSRFGVQGHIQLIEGTASDRLTRPDIPAIFIERRFPAGIQSIPITSFDLIAHYPHAKEEFFYEISSAVNHPIEKLEAWIAYDKGFSGYGVEIKDLELPPINWKDVPESTYRALFWIADLFDPNLFETLTEKQWPLLESLKNKTPQEQYETWIAQIYAARDELPPPPSPPSQGTLARMSSIYLLLFPPSKEAPLQHEIAPLEQGGAPALRFQFDQEIISLLFNGMKWPSKDHNHLFRFQLHQEKFPYLVRLHQARDIKHPGSNQTASYECDLTLLDKKTGDKTACLLKMNQVYETHDGYRFYLSGMGSIDRFGTKSVQLVVNKDPAKMALTYPGGILVALGTCLLFFRRF